MDRIVGGLVVTGVAFALSTLHLVGGWILPVGIVFGVLPMVGGLRRLIRDAEERRQRKFEALEGRQTLEIDRKNSLEKTILRIAKERKGVVTPARVVLESDLQLAEAEKALQDLAARGYAEMRLKDNGTIDYVFHDLM